MRNIAISPNASFAVPQRWSRSELPIALAWRSSLWRIVVPALWIFGCFFWLWLVRLETPRSLAVIPFALLFIGLPPALVAASVWWVMQLARKRTAARFTIDEDQIGWQFETDSDTDLLMDCGRFELVGKNDFEARIEWDMGAPDGEPAAGWPHWAARLARLRWLKSDRTLYARDVGLDRGGLESLCKLLNQLRDEATAPR